MGKKILYLLLIVAVSGLTGYFAAKKTLDRSLSDRDEPRSWTRMRLTKSQFHSDGSK